MLVKLSNRGTLTIPKDLREGLPEGAMMEAVVREDGVLELRPQARDPSQAWFWTKRWQRMEREADEAYAAGQYQTVDTMEDFFAALDAYVEAKKRKRAPRTGA